MIQGPKNYMMLLSQRARMEGFVYFDYASEFPSAVGKMVSYILKVRSPTCFDSLLLDLMTFSFARAN